MSNDEKTNFYLWIKKFLKNNLKTDNCYCFKITRIFKCNSETDNCCFKITRFLENNNSKTNQCCCCYYFKTIMTFQQQQQKQRNNDEQLLKCKKCNFSKTFMTIESTAMQEKIKLKKMQKAIQQILRQIQMSF